MSGQGEKQYVYEPDYAVVPGETLKETLESLGMTQRDLSTRTGLSVKTINQIIKGKAPISPDTSILLEKGTGVPARFWNNLESNYREQLAKMAGKQRLESYLEMMKNIPVREAVKRNKVKDSKN
jgi:addiction module HigA family antidote